MKNKEKNKEIYCNDCHLTFYISSEEMDNKNIVPEYCVFCGEELLMDEGDIFVSDYDDIEDYMYDDE